MWVQVPKLTAWLLTATILQRGEKALSGEEEYLPSHLFTTTDKEYWIKARGSLIVVFDPKIPEYSIWEWTNENEYGPWTHVPVGCRVKVLHGWVTMSTSAPT
jgi:hypothetical protein